MNIPTNMATPNLASYGTLAGVKARATQPLASTPAPTASPTPAPTVPLGQRDISTLTADDINRAFGGVSKASKFKVETPQVVGSDKLSGKTTEQDVYDARMDREVEATDSQKFQDWLISQGTSPEDAAQEADFRFPEENPEVAQAYENERSLIGKAGDFFKTLVGGKSSAEQYQERLDDAGYENVRKQREESNMRLAKLRGEQLRIRPQIESEAGQTRVGAEARLSPIERNLTAEIGAEALIQAALTGNMELMEANATKLMDFEFRDQDRAISAFESRLKLERARIENLEGQGKQQAAARLAVAEEMLQARKDKLEAAKDEKEQLIDFAKDYVKATQDGAGAAAILKGTYQDAIVKYGGALSGGAGTTITLTPEQRRLVVDAGWTEQDALSLESDVRKYGVESVVANATRGGATSAQISAIRNAFGGGQTMPRTIDRTAIKGIFGSSLSTKAKDAGFYTQADDGGFWGRATDEVIDTESYLNAIMGRVDLMRSQNMSDQDIIKELLK